LVCTAFAFAGAAISGLVLKWRDVPKAAELPSTAV
jgi:hypothetical protein